MTPERVADSILRRPGVVVLPGNRGYATDWDGSGGSVERQPSGHLVFYDRHGYRFLLTDPEGTVLHECEWREAPSGSPRLHAVRLHLDWGQWVGIKPEGLVNRTVFDLSRRPGWQSMTRDDLRIMAARAMNTSLETVRFFYPDEDLVIDPSGTATVHQRKDAFYMLEDGRFQGARFLSCMSRMHWHAIDYLPVVELFLSLLPGTGSATFELIRGLYDDQNPDRPRPLRYRGIPPYPSVGAYHLFRQFFDPALETGGDPLPVFLDPARSHEVIWTPAPDPPVRYFAPEANLCVTVKNGVIQKVTDAADSTGQPFHGVSESAAGLSERRAIVRGGHLILEDGATRKTVPLDPAWNVGESPASSPPAAFGGYSWRDVFPLGPPRVSPREAFSAVLLYPEDDTVIGERESQPFVFDYFDDLLDEEPRLQSVRSAQRVLIDQCDGALGACVRLDAPKDWTILYAAPALAQKHAQTLWSQLRRQCREAWLSHIRFFPHDQADQAWDKAPFDLIYLWLPCSAPPGRAELETHLAARLQVLNRNGVLLVGGPGTLFASLRRSSAEVILAQPVEELPTFRIHRSILPRARLHPELTAYIVRKR